MIVDVVLSPNDIPLLRACQNYICVLVKIFGTGTTILSALDGGANKVQIIDMSSDIQKSKRNLILGDFGEVDLPNSSIGLRTECGGRDVLIRDSAWSRALDYVENSDATLICGFNNIEATARYIASNFSKANILKIVLADYDRLCFEDSAVAGALISYLEEFIDDRLSLSDTSNLVYFQWENLERRGQIFQDCTLKSARMCVARFAELHSRFNGGSEEDLNGAKEVKLCMERDIHNFVALRTETKEFTKQLLDQRSSTLPRSARTLLVKSFDEEFRTTSTREINADFSRDDSVVTADSLTTPDFDATIPIAFNRTSLYNNIREAERMEAALLSSLQGAMSGLDMSDVSIQTPSIPERPPLMSGVSIDSTSSFTKLPSPDIMFLTRAPSQGARLAELKKESMDIDQFEQKIFDNLANLQRQLGLENFQDSEALLVEADIEYGLSELELDTKKLRTNSIKNLDEINDSQTGSRKSLFRSSKQLENILEEDVVE